MRVARQSRFHRILDQAISRRKQLLRIERKLAQGTADPALPVRQCRPLEGVTRRRRGSGVGQYTSFCVLCTLK